MAVEVKEIEITLPDVKHLFVIPEINPMEGKTIYEPGIETIDDLVRKIPMRDSILLKVFLPHSEIFPGLEEKINNGIRDYCDFQIVKIDRQLELESRQGRRTLIYGITILVICLLLSGLGFIISQNATTPLQYALGGFMYNGFMIIGWVSLWTPTSMLVFERWPDWISRNTFKRMRKMDIRVIPRNDNEDNG
jgi:hypothetical protein